MHRHRPPVTPSLRRRHELDATVANMELTLVSIAQGVALYFLTDSARPVLLERKWSALPYLASSLLIIFGVWSRSMIFAFTVIRWPLDLGHNFFYIAFTVVEASLFSQIANPAAFYLLSVIMAALLCALFVYDLRTYRARTADSSGPEGAVLLPILESEHRLNMRVLAPAMLVSWSGLALLVNRYPATFIGGGWHVALGAAQALGLLGYLAHIWRFYTSIAERVMRAREEWGRE